jgi:hypothetical protein
LFVGMGMGVGVDAVGGRGKGGKGGVYTSAGMPMLLIHAG